MSTSYEQGKETKGGEIRNKLTVIKGNIELLRLNRNVNELDFTAIFKAIDKIEEISKEVD